MADDLETVPGENRGASGRTWTSDELLSAHSEMTAIADDAVSRACNWNARKAQASVTTATAAHPSSPVWGRRPAQTTAHLGAKAPHQRTWLSRSALLAVVLVLAVAGVYLLIEERNGGLGDSGGKVLQTPSPPEPVPQPVAPAPQVSPEMVPQPSPATPATQPPPTYVAPQSSPPEPSSAEVAPPPQIVRGTGLEAINGFTIQIFNGEVQPVSVRLHGIEPSYSPAAMRALTNLIRRQRMVCRLIIDEEYRCVIVGTDYDVAAYLIEKGLAAVVDGAPEHYQQLARGVSPPQRNAAPERLENNTSGVDVTPQGGGQVRRQLRNAPPPGNWDLRPRGIGR